MASMQDISTWFHEGVTDGATHLIVVVDTYDHEDYPTYVYRGQDVRERITHANSQSMQRVMEVYNLSKPKQPQLFARRAWDTDPAPEPEPATARFADYT